MSDKSGAGVSGSGKKYETKLTGQGAAALAACILDGWRSLISRRETAAGLFANPCRSRQPWSGRSGGEKSWPVKRTP